MYICIPVCRVCIPASLPLPTVVPTTIRSCVPYFRMDENGHGQCAFAVQEDPLMKRNAGARGPSGVGVVFSSGQDYTPRAREQPRSPARQLKSTPWSSLPSIGSAAVPDMYRRQRPGDGVPRLAGIPDTPPPPRRRPIPLPPQMQGVTSVTLHPALRAKSGIDIDFASPRTSTESNAAWDDIHLSRAPATSPALPSLTIESPQLPWVITAHPSGRVDRFLTVADVIVAIWDTLRLQVNEEQFEDWEMMTRSHRAKRSGYRRGMTRLDLLQGKTRFVGLSESTTGCDNWVLEVA
ncbi:hypothetical protein B0H12DRAFT_1152679 [Mycena haematopus]|nr:hypothetical protein B0H12DRAFT_1152679 [Mycena haematopus]